MAVEYRTHDLNQYEMDYQAPHRQLEPLTREIAVVDDCLDFLVDEGVLLDAHYPKDKMLAHRHAVEDAFEIPWTAITPRMERLLYAVNAIVRPQVMIAAGIFCGFTFICNAGAAVGPGARYEAEELVGLEIDEQRAARARSNLRRLDATAPAQIIQKDAVQYVANSPNSIELLYLDADGTDGRGKAIYLDILKAAFEQMPDAAVVLAHNSFNCANQLREYFQFVRNKDNMSESANVIIDGEGLEVSVK